MRQTKIFTDYRIITPSESYGLDEKILEAKDIVLRAIVEHDPYGIGLMLSGGDDSITALKVALMLGVKIDFILHGVTGTGLKDVRIFVHKVARMTGIRLIEANAGDKFEVRVKKRGFFGMGVKAHAFSYHILKASPFRAAISKHIRKNKKGRKLLLLNGVRIEESENRADNFGDNPYREDDCGNVWVNIIHWFTKKECLHLLDCERFERSPVAIALGRSGECNCGTMQNEASRLACAQYDPEWGEWMRTLRRYVVAKFGFDIHQQPDKKTIAEMKAVTDQLDDFMPMCIGCKAQQSNLFL